MSKDFETQEKCLAYLFALQHAEARCGVCGRISSFHKHPSKPCFTCTCGRTHIYPQTGTLFEQSRLPLPVWFKAMRLFHDSQGTIGAAALQRELGVTYKTAWRMTKEIRLAAKGPVSGPFEQFLERCLECRL